MRGRRREPPRRARRSSGGGGVIGDTSSRLLRCGARVVDRQHPIVGRGQEQRGAAAVAVASRRDQRDVCDPAPVQPRRQQRRALVETFSFFFFGSVAVFRLVLRLSAPQPA